jgi:Spy/CpxP family protein refolding chaperone
MALLVVDHDLDLTEAQQTALHALRHSRRVGLRVTDALIVAGESELRSELGKPSPDTARVHAMVDQVLTPYQAMTHATVDRALAFHATLSASQLAALSQSSQSSE